MVEHNSHKTGQLHRAITGLFYHLLLLQYYNLRTKLRVSVTVQQSQGSSIKIYQEFAVSLVSHGQLIVVAHYLAEGGSCLTIKTWGTITIILTC